MRHFISTCSVLLLFLLLLHAPARAQQVIWAEDFTYHAQQNFSAPWGTAGNSVPWSCDLAYLIGTVCFPYTGDNTKVAGVSDFMLPTGPRILCGTVHKNETDVLLMAPPVSLAGVTNPWFRYDSYFLKQANGGTTESATVEISTDSGVNWTVLKNAPVTPPGGHMITSYVNLGAYAGAASIRLGFRYSDSLQFMTGWMIDNLSIFVPAAQDIALTHLDREDTMLSYIAAPATISLRGVVMNVGTAPITSFAVAYRDGNGPVQTHTVTGVHIAPFDTLGFVHSVPYSLTVGKHNLRVWAMLPGDNIHTNDTLPLSLSGAYFMPVKKLAIEEGTGTWNLQAPHGYVFLHALDASDDPPTRISVHSGDVMDQRVYADYLFFMDQNYTPYFLFDRRGPVPFSEFFSAYDVQRNYFGFADIGMQASAAAGYVSVDVTIKPAINLPGGYSLALVVTEDGVTGTGSAYDQANGYAGGKLGPMGGFENKPDPVPASDMKYDYVARNINPAPEGRAGCLPANMQGGQSYTCNLRGTYSSTSKFNNLNAVVLFIRNADSTILNSRTVPFRSLGVESIAGKSGIMSVYPNPAGLSATVAFGLPVRSLTSLMVTDITGRALFQYPSGWLNAGQHIIGLNTGTLPAGMYFVTLHAGDQQETVKLSVQH